MSMDAVRDKFLASADRMAHANRKATRALELIGQMDLEDLDRSERKDVLYTLESTQLELNLSKYEHSILLEMLCSTVDA